MSFYFILRWVMAMAILPIVAIDALSLPMPTISIETNNVVDTSEILVEKQFHSNKKEKQSAILDILHLNSKKIPSLTLLEYYLLIYQPILAGEANGNESGQAKNQSSNQVDYSKKNTSEENGNGEFDPISVFADQPNTRAYLLAHSRGLKRNVPAGISSYSNSQMETDLDVQGNYYSFKSVSSNPIGKSMPIGIVSEEQSAFRVLTIPNKLFNGMLKYPMKIRKYIHDLFVDEEEEHS